MTSRQVRRVLAKAGWRVDRQQGSHVMLVRGDGTGLVVVPDHPGDLRPGTVRAILKQAGLTPDEFNRLRRE
ncbi:MAG: type II toxin-antitoxin system HicA family toxin [Chloroflexia bacterium]|nr:type II toxin-antitoxin system HicA family toxin [Chloroflexia bacterium]